MEEQKLVRAIGLKEIIALTINGIIGAGIFALPASAAKTLGVASPFAFAIAGLFAAIIVLCFAELGGKFDRTGGAYLYAEEAFGGLIAFLIGWMYFLARLTSVAALTNALIGFAGYFFPLVSPVREICVVSILLALGLINYSGVRFSSRLINFLTLAKMIPLLIFIAAGLFFVNWSTFSTMKIPEIHTLTGALLLMMFAFSGFEVIGVPGAEIIAPRQNLPLGLLIGTGITILIYVLIQTVAVGVDPVLGNSEAPLAEAATIFMGTKGGTLLTAAAVCSTIGTLTSLLLVGPRILYAMALNQKMPQAFSQIHSRFLTPHVSILFYTVFAIGISLSGSFTTLATLSAIARMITYMGSAIALIVLRRKMPSADTFQIPGGFFIPVVTILLSLFLLTAATRMQWITGLIAILVGLVLYFVGSRQHTKHK